MTSFRTRQVVGALPNAVGEAWAGLRCQRRADSPGAGCSDGQGFTGQLGGRLQSSLSYPCPRPNPALSLDVIDIQLEPKSFSPRHPMSGRSSADGSDPRR